MIQFNKSEFEVLQSILGIKSLKKRAVFLSYKRHTKAIEKLKKRQIIYKHESTNLLKIYNEHIVWVKSQINKYC